MVAFLKAHKAALVGGALVIAVLFQTTLFDGPGPAGETPDQTAEQLAEAQLEREREPLRERAAIQGLAYAAKQACERHPLGEGCY